MNRVAHGPLLRDLGEGFRATPGRAGLSLLAIFIGGAALAILLATLEGLRSQARDMVRMLGANVFAITAESLPGSSSRRHLDAGHLNLLRHSLPDLVFAPVRRARTRIGPGAEIQLVRTDHQLARIRRWDLAEGRFLDEVDIADRARSAVVTKALADAFQLHSGRIVMLGQKPYDVVGVIRGGPALLPQDAGSEGDGGSEYLAVFVPYTTPPYWTTAETADDRLDAIYVQAALPGRLDEALRACRMLFQQPGQDAPVSWVTPETLLQRIRRVQRIIEWTAGSITVLCFILGGTTMMSMMLNSVRERIPEIGLRMALGGTRMDIAILFVAEAIVLTLSASLAASLAVHGVLAAARAHLPMQVQFSWITLWLPVLASVAVGAIFSYLPARRAAHVSPAQALREE